VELNQLNISHEDLRQSLEEQEATVLSLQQAAEDTRKALESERKQVEGKFLLSASRLLFWFTRDPLPI
jgi:outer membrane protein TolC